MAITLSGVHSFMMEKSAQPGVGGGCTSTPRSLYLPSRTKFGCIPAESSDALDLFLLYPYMCSVGRVSSKQRNKNFGWNRNETRSVLVVFRFVSWKQKQKSWVCFGILNLYRNNRNKQNFFETNRNSFSNCLGWSSVCFGSIKTSKLSAKQPKQTFCFG